MFVVCINTAAENSDNEPSGQQNHLTNTYIASNIKFTW